MLIYEKLGYDNLMDYQWKFLDTLLPTNQTYDFFVDFDKVYNNLNDNLVDINILNTLTNVDESEIEDKFKEIILEYPSTIQILPSILAVRKDNIPIFDIDSQSFYEFNFKRNNHSDINLILDFAKNTGLLNLFLKINDLYTYLIGSEVGLDTNARKNRSGTSFKKMIESFLIDALKNKPEFTISSQEKVKIDEYRKFDFVIFKNYQPKYVIQCNFYGTAGSKPNDVAINYGMLDKNVKNNNCTFLWIIDGLGWEKMKKPLNYAFENIDNVINYNILKNNFEKIIE